MLPVIVRRCIRRFLRLVACPYLVSHLPRQFGNPGFSRRKGSAKMYYLARFYHKLHENERNWTKAGERGFPSNLYTLDPTLRGDTCTSL